MGALEYHGMVAIGTWGGEAASVADGWDVVSFTR